MKYLHNNTQADDEHADSLRKHPTSCTSRGSKSASTAGGANDHFEEPVEMLGGEGEADDGMSEGTQSESGCSVRMGENGGGGGKKGRAVSSQFLPEDDDSASAVHSSLGWELAHILHVCLGQYLKPGGASPGVSHSKQ